MGLTQFLGIIIILTGITMTVFNFITMSKIKDTCKNDIVIKNTNIANLILSLLLTLIGLIVYLKGGNSNSTNGFRFG